MSDKTIPLSKELLEVMMCPRCGGSLRQSAGELLCEHPPCGARYPIREGIPIMLVESTGTPTRTPPA